MYIHCLHKETNSLLAIPGANRQDHTHTTPVYTLNKEPPFCRCLADSVKWSREDGGHWQIDEHTVPAVNN